VLASPGIVLTLSAFGRIATDNQLWIVASQVRFPHHLYPLTWTKRDFSKFSVLVFLLVAFLYQNRHKMEKLFRNGVIWTGVSLLWLLYAFVAAYIAKLPSMLVMHPARGTDLWYCFAGVALVSVCAVQVEESRGRARRIFFTAVFGISILIWNLVLGLCIVAACFIALALRPMWYYILAQGSSKRLALLLTILVVVLGGWSFERRLSKTRSVEAALIRIPSDSVAQIADWASANTSMNAQFLVDPTFSSDWEQFRGLAKRSVFVTWKDGSAILWDRSYVQAWAERINALGLDITQEGLDHEKAVGKFNQLYEKLQDKDIKRLQSRFVINYWVVPRKHPSTFPVAFQNQSYKVLNLK
jgi:hypothetical protein